MSRRAGRPRNAMPSAVWKVCIPLDLAAQIELLLHDPLRGKTKYGSRGALIELALRTWIATQLATPAANDASALDTLPETGHNAHIGEPDGPNS